MDKKSRNTIIISIVALAIVLITVTYAYFSARITGLESASTISLTAGTMGIVYEEGNENVTASNIYPREEAWVTKTFTLTGNNTTSLTMNYGLGLNVIENTFNESYLTYSLTNTKNDGGTPVSDTTNVRIISNGKQYFGYGKFTSGSGIEHKYTLNIYFKDNGLNQNDSQGAVFNAKIFVTDYPEQTLPESAPENWYGAESGSLLAAIRDNSEVKDTITPPGRMNNYHKADNQTTVPLSQVGSVTVTYAEKFSDLKAGNNTSSGVVNDIYEDLIGKFFASPVLTQVYHINYAYLVDCDGTNFTAAWIPDDYNSDYYEEEAFLSSAPDDYGTSYYYRGAVENNYVVFAGMCWRIVRVDGLGNTKLVLYNYNPNNVQNPCAASEDGTTNAFARYNNSYVSEFNTSGNKNTYVGYMYSNNPDSNDFDTAHANDNDSTILTFLKNWYDTKLRSYNDKLADVIWCNDKSIVTDTTYDPGSITPAGTGLGTSATYYKATQRLYPVNTAAPSLVCPTAGSDGKLSKFTARDNTNGNAKLSSNNKEYKIGLLTADEIAFAGGIAADGNSSYYLYKNANDGANWYWSLSPRDFSGRNARVWGVLGAGELYGSSVNSVDGVRPSISLKSTVSIVSGGTGTSSNPFVVSA